ncbi:RIO kinase 1 [Enteropsectra breve]|nr:RIO kinase 1 [Enteropsectra breve]
MKEYKVERRKKDKADTATVDKVLDPKTMNILKKLQERKKLIDLGGTFSSGKEANVYTAKCSTSLISKFIQKEVTEEEQIVPVVLKIYKTSTMQFKDRERYIVNEKRFSNFCTGNSRKLMKVWAEKEVRNLKRLQKHGIPSPKPLYLKRSILVMTMIGDKAPAKRLKDADPEDWNEVYAQCLELLKQLYQKAGLVHADFSEYNLIYHENKVFVIDVGQAVERDHENSNSFLCMDIQNCNDFFQKKNVAVKSEVDIFEEITGLKIPVYLKKDGKLNKDNFIPTRITEVVNKEDISLFIPTELLEKNKKMQKPEESESSDDGSLSNSMDDEALSDFEESNINNDSANNDSVNNDSISNELSEENSGFKMPAEDKDIDILVRRMRLKNPEITKEQEKDLNKRRKAIVKEMNRERRKARAERCFVKK